MSRPSIYYLSLAKVTRQASNHSLNVLINLMHARYLTRTSGDGDTIYSRNWIKRSEKVPLSSSLSKAFCINMRVCLGSKSSLVSRRNCGSILVSKASQESISRLSLNYIVASNIQEIEHKNCF